MGQTSGVIAAVLLAAICVLHFYWAEGGHWPARDGSELSERVIGPGMPPPPRMASWVVGALLLAAAALVASAGLGSTLWVVTAGAVTVAGVLALRGFGGLLWSGFMHRDSLFARMDRRIYSPLCLCLSFLALNAAF